MPDVYATIAEADRAVQEQLSAVLELRAAEPQQRAMLHAYLDDIEFPPDAHVLELGCGPGPVARVLAALPGVGRVLGVDPSPVFLQKARELGAGVAKLDFAEGDARALDLEDGAFDIVVCHTSLCHIPGPERVLAEAFRLLKRGGALAVFDGDYATTTLATGDHDPLQLCADAAIAGLVHDRWLVRRLPTLVRAAGFQVGNLRSHGFVETAEPGYMLTLADRGADLLAGAGRIGAETAAVLKAEARRRVAQGQFFGHIAYASLIAHKPA